MQKYLLSSFLVSSLFLMSGCQTTQTPSNLFLPFTPSATSSANLSQKVQEALARSDDPAIAQVHVESRQDVVILKGYVKKIRQSDVAEQIARQVPGVRVVENHIIIRQ